MGDQTPGFQDLAQAVALAEGRHQEQQLRFERKLPSAGGECPLQAFRQRHQARHHAVVVELVCDGRQLGQGQRVARRLVQDASALGRRKVILAAREQAIRRLRVEWLQPKLRQLAGTEHVRVALARCRQQDDRVGLESPRDEAEDIYRRLVKPMCVLGDKEQGAIGRRVR